AGALYAPRLARREPADAPPPPLDPETTVLIAGGTGDLGALMARHLASAHGARHLLLTTTGPAGEQLSGELEALGCEVRIAPCDIADRTQLEGVLAEVPAAHPVSLVVHAERVSDDGVIERLDRERLARVMAPKVSGTINLHQLTEPLGAQLILFS